MHQQYSSITGQINAKQARRLQWMDPDHWHQAKRRIRWLQRHEDGDQHDRPTGVELGRE
jgi:hypothetical protein